MINKNSSRRVLSGMRPTGKLHLGHYHGVLKNWIKLQNEYECWFFIADWHALTTMYADTGAIADNIFDTVVDWLAVGLDPDTANIFIQSQVPEHAELQLILGMITPVSWLERVPSYKDYMQQQKESGSKEPSSFGFLGYPLLQSADILLYRPGHVPVGADQEAHVEIARDIAKRFNHLYGREPDFKNLAEAAIAKLGKKAAASYRGYIEAYQEQGDREALEKGRILLSEHLSLSIGDRERLVGYLSGGGRIILPEPEVMLTQTSKLPGLNGEKMSKSHNNTITLRDTNDEIANKIVSMKTDPARKRRHDPGDPKNCPVADLHEIYSDQPTKEWMQNGCLSAGIGCLECKQPIIEAVQAEITPIRSEAKRISENRGFIWDVVEEGATKAREAASATLEEVRHALDMSYRK